MWGAAVPLRPHIKGASYPHKDILMWSICQIKRSNEEDLTCASYQLLRIDVHCSQRLETDEPEQPQA